MNTEYHPNLIDEHTRGTSDAIVTVDNASEIGQPKATRTVTILNRASVKRYALAVSKAKRAGKFTRVGETFLIGCEAELESKLRQLANEVGGQTPTDGFKFTTKLTRQKALEKLELLAATIISGKVMRHPSLGQTLKD